MDGVTEIDDLFLLCRLCIIGQGKFAIVRNSKIHNSIKKVFGVKINPYDGLPQLICIECKEKLLEIENIRGIFASNQEILSVLKTNYTQNVEKRVIKAEPPDESDDIDQENDTQNTSSPVGSPGRSIDREKSTNDNISNEKMENETKGTKVSIKKESNLRLKDSIHSTLDVGPPETAVDSEYVYYCRLCNDKFDSVFKFRNHSKSHENLIQLQRRYTPYNCSVRIHKIKEYPTEANVYDNQFSHPLFFIRKRKMLTANRDADPPSVIANNNNLISTHSTEEISSVASQIAMKIEPDTTNVFQTTIPCDSLSNPALLNFEPVLHDDCDIPHNQEVETKSYIFDSLKISDIIHNRIYKHCLAEEESELELVHNTLIGLCKSRIRVIWKERKNSPEIVLKSSGEANMQANDLAEFELVPDAPKPGRYKVAPKITGQFEMNSNLQGGAIIQNNFGHVVLNNPSENGVNAEESSAELCSYDDNIDNTDMEFATDEQTVVSHTQSDENINSNSTGGAVLIENSTMVSESDALVNYSNNMDCNNVPAVLPRIVSTSTIPASTVVAESTSVYIDLEDAELTITSDHFNEQMTPLMFFKHILKKEGLFLSFEKQSPQAVTLVCYKKNVDDIGDFMLTVSTDDIIFYMEISKGKKIIDLTKETVLTQWLLLSSINQPKIETIMKNYAKRFCVDVNRIEKFSNIIRSISGVITGDTIRMEAPNRFFF